MVSEPDEVAYSTAVRVQLPNLNNAAKHDVWRDRQIQAQGYNWGVEHALGVFFADERIQSARTHSQPLTKYRQKAPYTTASATTAARLGAHLLTSARALLGSSVL